MVTPQSSLSTLTLRPLSHLRPEVHQLHVLPLALGFEQDGAEGAGVKGGLGLTLPMRWGSR